MKVDKKLKLFGGRKVDAIKHWQSEVKRLGDEIAKTLKDEELDNYTRTALVTFTTKQRAYDVQQVVIERRSFKMMVHPAPAPEDLLYNPCHYDEKQAFARSSVVFGAF